MTNAIGTVMVVFNKRGRDDFGQDSVKHFACSAEETNGAVVVRDQDGATMGRYDLQSVSSWACLPPED